MRLLKRVWLVQLREQKELTQAQVAVHCGVVRQAVTAWESGEQSPSREAMFNLAELLGPEVIANFAKEHAMAKADSAEVVS